jgi:hypothetical protein
MTVSPFKEGWLEFAVRVDEVGAGARGKGKAEVIPR